jgi:hypothetical protein
VDISKSTQPISVAHSAAFKTNDHQILLCCLAVSFKFTGNTLDWFHSCITDSVQAIRNGGNSFAPIALSNGVPQGSTLQRLPSRIYTSVAHISLAYYDTAQQQYANETQFYIALSIPDYSLDILSLEDCLATLLPCYPALLVLLQRSYQKSEKI